MLASLPWNDKCNWLRMGRCWSGMQVSRSYCYQLGPTRQSRQYSAFARKLKTLQAVHIHTRSTSSLVDWLVDCSEQSSWRSSTDKDKTVTNDYIATSIFLPYRHRPPMCTCAVVADHSLGKRGIRGILYRPANYYSINCWNITTFIAFPRHKHSKGWWIGSDFGTFEVVISSKYRSANKSHLH